VVRADPGAARQVLANLIGNALKFSARADQPRVEVGLAPDGMLYVRDNGVGFDPQLAPQLFKPFQRLHADDSGYPGTGVGLSIVKRLLERHGGEIRAESRPGRGTTFAFSFGPVAPG
jgi:signal transduction histidine kinase